MPTVIGAGPRVEGSDIGVGKLLGRAVEQILTGCRAIEQDGRYGRTGFDVEEYISIT